MKQGAAKEKPLKSLRGVLASLAKVPSIPCADFVIELRARGLISEKDRHAFLKNLFAASRYKEIVGICAAEGQTCDVVDAFNMLRLFRVSQLPELEPEWIERACSTPDDHFLKDSLCNSAIDCLIRVEDVVRVSALLREISDKTFIALAFPTLRGACNLFIKHSRLDLMQNLLRRQPAGSPDLSLYFLDMEVTAGLRPVSDAADWRQLLGKVQVEYPWVDEQDKTLFATVVADPMRRISATTEWELWDIRYNETEQQRIKDIFKDCLKTNRPLSLIRLGDGESYAFPDLHVPGLEPEMLLADRQRREEIWWGAQLEPTMSEQIRGDVYRAICNADMLGVPSVHRVIRDLGKAGKPIFQSPSLRGVGVVLHSLSEVLDKKQIVTEERCHQTLFTREFLSELASLAKKVVVVSCWSEDEMRLSLHPQTTYIEVPPHNKVKHLVSGEATNRSLTLEYGSIADAVGSESEPGTLVLVAAGLLGKVLIDRARAAGAVALDVGAVVDYFAGHKTRSIADMV